MGLCSITRRQKKPLEKSQGGRPWHLSPEAYSTIVEPAKAKERAKLEEVRHRVFIDRRVDAEATTPNTMPPSDSEGGKLEVAAAAEERLRSLPDYPSMPVSSLS